MVHKIQNNYKYIGIEWPIKRSNFKLFNDLPGFIISCIKIIVGQNNFNNYLNNKYSDSVGRKFLKNMIAEFNLLYLRLIILLREMFRNRNATIRVKIGIPIFYQTFNKYQSHWEWVQGTPLRLYEHSKNYLKILKKLFL